MSDTSSVDRLSKALGYDPAKQSGNGSEVFQNALKKIQKKRDEELEAKAEELLQKAIDLRMKMDEADRQFNSQKKKFDKELGKLLSRIEAFSRGESPAAIDAKEAEAAEAAAG